ncbi:hypothetical protein VFPPC_15126 [Pochonia chlamydosporia 170]|uniref:Uncharacterized protein n=1 Tax=Pochonia chlamydosporia 170 TaxID=1380566 RepID=A0A179G3T3_METCM|nr:hypothetical protein VFPPC_15126 [Pochonia chlamydosporia 170]OAQ72427.1 hypothetical protein VFPPC_15126 [Pochonia chlamydosporia 170]
MKSSDSAATMEGGDSITSSPKTPSHQLDTGQPEIELCKDASSHQPTSWLKLTADIHEKSCETPHPDPVPTSGADLVNRPRTPTEAEPKPLFLSNADDAPTELQPNVLPPSSGHGSATDAENAQPK